MLACMCGCVYVYVDLCMCVYVNTCIACNLMTLCVILAAVFKMTVGERRRKGEKGTEEVTVT